MKFSEMSVMLLRMKFVVTFRLYVVLTSFPLVYNTIFRHKTAKIASANSENNSGNFCF